MRYHQPDRITESQILCILESARESEEIIDAALSAIYYCETEFSGRALLKAYAKVPDVDLKYLGNMTCSFLQMHQTDFLSDHFVQELQRRSKDLDDIIDEIKELKSMFAKGPK